MTETTTDWYSEEAATFGDRLAAARDQTGLTQKALAERLGVSKSVLVAWEEDIKEPRANRLQMLSGMLNVSLRWLLTGVGDGPEEPADDLQQDPDVVEILTEMRGLRARMIDCSQRLGQLEKRLRKASRRQ